MILKRPPRCGVASHGAEPVFNRGQAFGASSFKQGSPCQAFPLRLRSPLGCGGRPSESSVLPPHPLFGSESPQGAREAACHMLVAEVNSSDQIRKPLS